MKRRELIERCLASGALLLAAPRAGASKTLKATPFCELGPFYKRNAPAVSQLHADGLPLAVSGSVYGTGGEPVQGARIEIWQADSAGHYDLEGDKLRASLTPGEKGAYAFESVMPGHYPGRVAQHVHYLITAPGYRPLTTQLYFATDPAFDGDARNFSRDPIVTSIELVRPVRLISDDKAARAEVKFDLVLEKA